MRLEWDDVKNRRNREKHGISFEEARHLFTSGVESLEIFDVEHSEDEDRFIVIGPTERGVVVVVYAQGDDDVIRLIGARFATKSEEVLFTRYWARPV